ncbi:hypothetical protein ACVI1L_004440 [Bradyrhizobium sp. USDA 4516]
MAPFWLPDRDSLKSTASDVLKDGRKKAVLYVFGVLLAPYILGLFQKWYNLDHTPDWTEVAPLLWSSLKNYPFFIHDMLRQATSFALLNPAYALLLAFLVAGFGLLVYLLAHARRQLNRQSTILQTADISNSLLSQSGLKARYPHAKTTEDGAPWGALREEVLHPSNKFVHILGANGIDTFGRAGAPLHDTLKDFRGTIRVILCDPKTNKQMVGRAKAVGVSPTDYVKAINASKRRLSELRKAQLPVEGRFYNGQPNWKLIMTSTGVWLQYYLPGGPHVDETPVWLISVTPNPDGLYHLFHMEFERIWDRCKGSPMGL